MSPLRISSEFAVAASRSVYIRFVSEASTLKAITCAPALMGLFAADFEPKSPQVLCLRIAT